AAPSTATTTPAVIALQAKKRKKAIIGRYPTARSRAGRSAGCCRIGSGYATPPDRHPRARPGDPRLFFVDGRVKPGHDELQTIPLRWSVSPNGHPAGPGPLKINEALVPPNPKEFDST